MTATRRFLIVFLLRAGQLTAALAVIAGIFGMHIMTGTEPSGVHSMPAAAQDMAQAQMPGVQSAGGHGPEQSSIPTAAAPMRGTAGLCSGGGSCPEMSGMADVCVLASGNTTLSAPMPGTAPYELSGIGATAAVSSTYSYSPDSHSPGELCISRT